VAEIVLVRHAATSWTGRRYCGRSDPPLSRDGEVAAAHLAIELASMLPPGIAIVTSSLRRALQTAEMIASVVSGAVLEIDDRWSEADFGVVDGCTYEEVTALAPALAARLAGGDLEIDWPGGEPAATLAARVEAAWHDLVVRGTAAVVVSHGGPLRLAMALATAREPAGIAVPEPGAFWRWPGNAPHADPATRERVTPNWPSTGR
jgi:broad specificity phosphatase PhoE